MINIKNMIKITTVVAFVAMTFLQPVMAEEPSGLPYNGQLDVNQYCTGILNNAPSTQQQFSGTAQLLQIACHNQHTYTNNMLTSVWLNSKNALDGIKILLGTTQTKQTDLEQKVQESDRARIATNTDYEKKLLKLKTDFTVKLMELQTELNAIKAMKQICAKENQIPSLEEDWSHFSTIVVVGFFVAMVYYKQNFFLYIFKYVSKSFADAEKARTKKIAAEARLEVNAEHQRALEKATNELKSTKEALTTAQQKITAEEEKASKAQEKFRALKAEHTREQMALAAKEDEFNKAVILMNENVKKAEYNALVAKTEVEEYKLMLSAAKSSEEAESMKEKAQSAQLTQVSQENEAAAAKKEIKLIENAKLALEAKNTPEQIAEITAAAEAAKKLEESVKAAKAEQERVAEEAQKKEAELQQLKKKLLKEVSFTPSSTGNDLSSGQISPKKLEIASETAPITTQNTADKNASDLELAKKCVNTGLSGLATRVIATVPGPGKESTSFVKHWVSSTAVTEQSYDGDHLQFAPTEKSWDPSVDFAVSHAGSVSGDLESQVADWWANQHSQLIIVFDHPKYLTNGFFIDMDTQFLGQVYREQANQLFNDQCNCHGLDPKTVARGLKPTTS